MKHLNLGTKFLSVGLLAVVIPIIIGIVAIYESTQNTLEMAKHNMLTISQSLAGALEIGLTKELQIVHNMSNSNAVIEATEKVARDGIKNSQKEIDLAQRELGKVREATGDHYSNILVAGRNGISFADGYEGKNKGNNLNDRETFKKAINGQTNIGEMGFSKTKGTVICLAGAPIRMGKDNQPRGAILMGLQFQFFSDIIGAAKIGKGGYAAIVDRNGLSIYNPARKEGILKVNISQVKGMEALMKVVGSGQGGIAEYVLEGMPKVAAIAPVGITGWSVVTTIPHDELLAPARYTRNVIIVIGVIFFILASVIFYFFARSITFPLTNVVEAAQKIAGGDLAVEVTSETRQDEIGSLARAFTLMVQSLKEKAQIAEKIAASDLTVKVTPLSDADTLGNAFSTMVEKLRGQIQQIIEGVNVLSSSASEIMASVSQLTSGAAQTATSVSETTTTLEEVKQTAEMTHQKAKQVSDLGQKNAEISRTGLKSIEDTINGMNRIREQMDSIADMVVRLSEQSQAIGEIIATVNDIAEQSNLLAVNASIEAAKAGEQGKGFAVVAQEIRSLAAQSKQATTQVRNILFDVQKAIGSAVMATERGSKAVEDGVKLSTQAGESIDILVESVVKEATNAAIQIAASSQQQLIGMDQVVSAMENIRESSLQMASSTKQTEKAAHDLHNLGQRLQEIVKLYKV
jgi:methyl-accepting chemotaxis protein